MTPLESDFSKLYALACDLLEVCRNAPELRNKSDESFLAIAEETLDEVEPRAESFREAQRRVREDRLTQSGATKEEP